MISISMYVAQASPLKALLHSSFKPKKMKKKEFNLIQSNKTNIKIDNFPNKKKCKMSEKKKEKNIASRISIEIEIFFCKT